MKGLTRIGWIMILASLPVMALAQDAGNRTIRAFLPARDPGMVHRFTSAYDVVNYRNDSMELSLSPAEFGILRKQYPELKALPASTTLDDSDMAASLEEALSFNKYPTYYQYDSMMVKFATDHPDICLLDTFGYSIQGRMLLALKISDNPLEHEDEPAFFYTGTIHGDELIAYNLLLRLAGFLLENYGSNNEVTQLVNNVEIWINPLSNPDGTYYPNNNLSVADSRRANINGYDLNRSFPDPASEESNDTTGRQQEVKEMMLFMADKGFNMSANLHSGSEVVNYPWDHTIARHPDDDWFIFISREYADEARSTNATYMDEFTNGITNGYDWYDIYGGRQDYTTYYLGGRELTLELSNVKKVPSENLHIYWEYNQWSLFNLISQARYGIHGNITNRETGHPVKARVRVLNHDDNSSVVYSDPKSGNFYRYLKEGTYDLKVDAEGYAGDTLYDVPVYDYQETTLEIQLDSLDTKLKIYGSEPPGISVSLYPNPADHILHVKIVPGAMVTGMQLIAADGRIMENLNTTGTGPFIIRLDDQPAGPCFLKVQLENGVIYRPVIIR